MSDWTNLQGLPPEAYNQSFLQKLAADPMGIQMVGDNFVRDRLREDMVMNQILPQTPITRDKLQVSLETDTLYEVIDLDANAAAAICDFRGVTRGQVVRAKRVPLAFHMIKSDEYEVVEQELLTYRFPIVKLVHEYSIKAVGDVHDLYMLQNAQSSVSFVDAHTAAAGAPFDYQGVFGGGTVRGTGDLGAYLASAAPGSQPLNYLSMTRAKQNLTNRIAPAASIVTKFDHDSISNATNAFQGDVLRSETFISGYKQDAFAGVRTIVTTKQDVFRRGSVWLFAAPEFLGKNRILDYGGSPYKLFIDRRSNVVTWHVYMTVGALFANVGSIVKLELFGSDFSLVGGTYTGAGVPIAGPSYAANAAAVDPRAITEGSLNQNRNLADNGGRFPNVVQF